MRGLLLGLLVSGEAFGFSLSGTFNLAGKEGGFLVDLRKSSFRSKQVFKEYCPNHRDAILTVNKVKGVVIVRLSCGGKTICEGATELAGSYEFSCYEKNSALKVKYIDKSQ